MLTHIDKLLESLRKMSISDEDLTTIKQYVLLEVRAGLGLIDAELDRFFIFPDIQALYDKRDEGCYFCSELVDTEIEDYGDKRGMCPECALKIENFLRTMSQPIGKGGHC